MECFPPGMLESVTEFLTCGTDSGSGTQRVNPLFHCFIFLLRYKKMPEGGMLGEGGMNMLSQRSEKPKVNVAIRRRQQIHYLRNRCLALLLTTQR
ncbi:TPA: hypothetical protein F6V26_17015 [Citrobacter freundii]|nr:hypothetical protein FR801_06600 [Citrobacter freundii]HAU4326016.1 hypothetical protein [Citrobacter freundii]